jgi:hypothetical protein
MERRRTIRLMTEKGLVAIGRKETGELVGAGWPLRDISEGGLRFAVPADLPNPPVIGDIVSVRVEFARHSEEGASEKKGLNLEAVVRRVHEGMTPKEKELSLEFKELTAADKASLRGTVLDLAVEKIATGGEILRESENVTEGEGSSARLGDILVTQDSISREDLEGFIKEDYEEGTPLGRQLVGRGVVKEGDVARALAEQSGLPYVDLDAEGIDLLKIRQFGETYLTQHIFVPLTVDQSFITLATASPLSAEVQANVEKQYNRKVRMVIASERQIVSAIQKAFYISRNRRQSARFTTGLSVRYKFYDDGWKAIHDQILSGLTKNISESGILFLGPLPSDVKVIPLEEKQFHIGVHLYLPNQKEPVRAPCELIRATLLRSEESRGGALCLYGVKVLGISEDDRKRLNLYRMQASIPRLFQDRYS